MPSESLIPPPRSALVLRANGFLTRLMFDWFVAKYLPAYEARVTSDYRTIEHNAQIGGAENSAHTHNLAIDFVLYSNGVPLDKERAKQVFNAFVLPDWPGFALFEESATAKPTGYHIHVNLSRGVTFYVSAFGAAGAAYTLWKLLKKKRKR